MSIRRDLGIRDPEGEPAQVLAPVVLGALFRVLRAAELPVQRRAAAQGCAWITTASGRHPLTICVGHGGSAERVALRVQATDTTSARLVIWLMPLCGVIGMVAGASLGGTWRWGLPGIVVGMGVGLAIAWWRWRSARRQIALPASLAPRDRESEEAIGRVWRPLAAELRTLGMEVETEAQSITGVDSEGVRATAGESTEEALALGDPARWTRLLRDALASIV